MNLDRGRSRGTLVAGILIIIIGVLLMLNQLELLPGRILVDFWPVVLVVIGILKVFGANERPDRTVGGGLIVAGTILQLNRLGVTHLGWGQIWPLFIIFIGVMLLFHAMSDKVGGSGRVVTTPKLDSFYIFGGGERQVTAKDFRSARLFAVFGGYEMDLTRADMEGLEAYVEANAVFGGGEIRVPTSWNVVVQGMGIFGGYDDKTQHVQTDPSAPRKTLYVRGVAVFGGVEIKN